MGPVVATVIILLLTLLSMPTSAQEVPELRINSKRYIVIDADTGEVFAQRGARDQVAMASLTKVFTAIEAIESAAPDVLITTTADDLVSPDNSMMGFTAGESFTLEDLLYGLMLPSGNDAANAIARSLGARPGDDTPQAVQRFIDKINVRVRDMGLADTNLMNPSGWGVPNHYSSAHDLAVFTMYAVQYPRFVELISALEHDTATGGYYLRNNNRLMTMYPSLLGGKTGFDYDAGWCLIEVARRDGNTMISVTLDGIHPDDWYDDNRVLLEYAFEQKEARIAANAPILGEVVSYRDPDAALIARIATSGGSIGRPAPASGSANAAGLAAPASEAMVDRRTRSGSLLLVQGDQGPNLQLLSAFVVVTVLLAGRALFTFSQPAARMSPVTGLPPRPKRLAWPRIDGKRPRTVRESDPAV
ncbi:MAG: D-alanyl-D-alanine carboxypeptidase [Chloroflexia bacterium]|nr:D-alanyl-D-alanine carboxypeptidase [Chloroflexia bacterium]